LELQKPWNLRESAFILRARRARTSRSVQLLVVQRLPLPPLLDHGEGARVGRACARKTVLKALSVRSRKKDFR
jgi:hypothetical protein